ncbi:D-cysteine desulfhydrase [uncultured Cetobacterium sp.]|uniref:D-cysteine desulfhydrase n=2 Tax=uncultured Cetobacterium sp. TaxID=527638 RepID=UPI00262ED5BD|nr:D-cysteine desulfhydrase [uncultured Cetobacterium sp.]
MNLAKFPRKRYTEGQTPIEKLENFSKALGGPTIYIKRDDLLGLTSGGNKTRKLEFLMADAIAKGADTILTCGAVQSNHCRLTLAAAVKEGLKCQMILEERVAGSYKPEGSGNNFLFNLLGVEETFVVPGGTNMMEELEKLAAKLEAEGRKTYIVPGGGSNPIGSTGYVACAEEIMSQLFEKGINIDHMVIPSGSAGTHAGIIAGMVGVNGNIPVTGVSVNRNKELQTNAVWNLAKATAERVGIATEITKDMVQVTDEYVGPGYSLPSDAMVEAVQLLARTEGILLDPVYTGKVMAGLIGMVREGKFKKEDNVLFLHTGGSPALYAYEATVLKK